jgi:DNA-binding MarR family transcriptional regulator
VTNLTFADTLHVRDTCLCLATQRAARTLARHFDEALRPLGLTNGQFSLLMSLNRPQPPGIGSVAELLGMDRTTLTAALKPLQRQGLVQIKVDPEDRRGRLLSLTAKGRTRLAEALPIWTKHHRRIEQDLAAPADLRQGLATLGKLNAV